MTRPTLMTPAEFRRLGEYIYGNKRFQTMMASDRGVDKSHVCRMANGQKRINLATVSWLAHRAEAVAVARTALAHSLGTPGAVGIINAITPAPLQATETSSQAAVAHRRETTEPSPKTAGRPWTKPTHRAGAQAGEAERPSDTAIANTGLPQPVDGAGRPALTKPETAPGDTPAGTPDGGGQAAAGNGATLLLQAQETPAVSPGNPMPDNDLHHPERNDQ